MQYQYAGIFSTLILSDSVSVSDCVQNSPVAGVPRPSLPHVPAGVRCGPVADAPLPVTPPPAWPGATGASVLHHTRAQHSSPLHTPKGNNSKLICAHVNQVYNICQSYCDCQVRNMEILQKNAQELLAYYIYIF